MKLRDLTAGRKAGPLVTMFLVRVIAAATSFLAQAAMVKIAGPSPYGEYITYVTAGALIVIFAKGGFDIMLIRGVTPRWTKRGVLPNEFLKRNAWQQVLLLSAVLVITGVVQALGLPSLLNYAYTPLAAFVSASVLCTFVIAVARSLSLHVVVDSVEQILRPVMLIASLAIMTKLGFQSGGTLIVILHALSLMAVAAVLIFAITNAAKRASPPPLEASNSNVGENGDASNSNWRASFHLTLINLTSYVAFQADTLFLAAKVSSHEVGAYNMACNFLRLVIFVPMIMAAVLGPKVATLAAENARENIRRYVNQITAGAAVAAALSFIVLTALGEKLLLMVSSTYSSAHLPLIILAFGQAANAITIVLSMAQRVVGNERDVFRCQLLGCTVSLAGYFTLIPAFGSVGAAASATAGMLLTMTLTLFSWRARFGK